MLVLAGVVMERPNIYGHTPLAHAILYNHTKVAEYLLHSGANMINVRESISILPKWMNQIVTKRKRAIRSTRILKGLLKKRFKVDGAEAAYLNGRIPKDMINLVGLYVWSTRLNKEWE